MVFGKLFGKANAASPAASAAPGERVYAIGDVHGCLTELDRLLKLIDDDHTARGGSAALRLIMVGDLVDRGPKSAQVVRRAQQITQIAGGTVIAGNHEELLLLAHAGERDALAVFHRAGGRDTLLSYGVDPADYDACALSDLSTLIDRVVPREHLDYMAELANWAVSGDYVFVHAGVRPGVALDQQVTGDLRWIREPFLSHKGSYGAVVVHGHTITDEPDVRINRIGIDTGAYASGVLTAIGLEGDQRWFLQTEPS